MAEGGMVNHVYDPNDPSLDDRDEDNDDGDQASKEMRQELYHLVQKVVRLKFSEKTGAVFSKKSQTSSKDPSGQKLIL